MKEERNFNSVSPSAKSLLLLKAFTDIPFAREMAALAYSPKPLSEVGNQTDFAFWARVLHFEKRYKSIDQLLKGLQASNILELASGYSMRGLTTTISQQVFYVDTDLPAVIEEKTALLAKLKDQELTPQGTLTLTALNALHFEELKSVCRAFPAGPITIVNEGLLMYLNRQEKERLCINIRELLKERGGCWITADIYIKQPGETPLPLPALTKAFFEQHHIEDNKFDSFEEAESFFKQMGFAVAQEASIDNHSLSSYAGFVSSFKAEKAPSKISPTKTQATWLLRMADTTTQ